MPAGLLRIFDRDPKMAGIPKKDERGRSLDVHAMRTTLSTLMNRAGMAPRTAQAAMRHGDVKLTMQTNTDPKLLDVRAAWKSPPALPLGGPQHEERQAVNGPSADNQPRRLALRRGLP